MRLFYDPHIASTLVLNETEAKHATKVLRLGIGDELQVIDGKGNLFSCAIKELTKRDCKVTILHKTSFEQEKHHIHIAISPTKNQDRIEWFVEKCIEIGVQEISFINCTRTERSKLNMERIERIAVSAMKQSLKYRMPQINEARGFKNFVQTCEQESKMIAHLNEGTRQYIHTIQHPSPSYCVLIGPEGDFTTDEVDAAIKHGFEAVSLGESRLRTETAGMVACTLANVVANKLGS